MSDEKKLAQAFGKHIDEEREGSLPILYANALIEQSIKNEIANTIALEKALSEITPDSEFFFKKYSKIPRPDNVKVRITQKVDGTNGQIVINDNGDMIVASKNRVLTDVKCDNHGFLAWTLANKDVLVQFLGVGRHYGEWCGPGINSGEGLTEKTFVLFDYWKYKDQEMPLTSLRHVPIIYDGTLDQILHTPFLDGLRTVFQLDGSRLVEGFTPVEGIVLHIDDKKIKIIYNRR